jgi:hypothetical protein
VKEEYPDLLAAGYGKETYFDEDPEWLDSLEPDILKNKKKPINRVRMGKRKLKRGSASTTTVGGVRL